MSEAQHEVIHALEVGLLQKRSLWESGRVMGGDGVRRRWSQAKIVTHNDGRIRVQLGDGSRWTITIEEDLL